MKNVMLIIKQIGMTVKEVNMKICIKRFGGVWYCGNTAYFTRAAALLAAWPKEKRV